MKPATTIVTIPLWSFYVRLLSDFILRLFFPRIIIDETNALKKAEAYALTGRGLVIIFTHFSLRDAMEVAFRKAHSKKTRICQPSFISSI